MRLGEYAAWARRVGGTETTTVALPEHLAYLGLGLAGEAGEAADVPSRGLRNGSLDAARLGDELGDVAYYRSRLCAACAIDPETVLARSCAKIEQRLAGRVE